MKKGVSFLKRKKCISFCINQLIIKINHLSIVEKIPLKFHFHALLKVLPSLQSFSRIYRVFHVHPQRPFFWVPPYCINAKKKPACFFYQSHINANSQTHLATDRSMKLINPLLAWLFYQFDCYLLEDTDLSCWIKWWRRNFKTSVFIYMYKMYLCN